MTGENTKTRRGVILYKENPFFLELKTKAKKITNKRGDMYLVSQDTNEIQSEVAGFWEVKEVDNAKFIKLFVKGVKALSDLTNAGARVFELLYYVMQNNLNKDKVYLSYTLFDEENINISETTFRRGLSELIKKNFLASTPAVGWYWINPNFIWNGDRLAFIKAYKKVPLTVIEQGL